MTTTNYLPGDRVQAAHNKGNVIGGWTGTIVKPQPGDENHVCVRFDRDVLRGERHSSKRPYRYWRDDHYIQRQPIEPGCWVRFEIPGFIGGLSNTKPGKIVESEGPDFWKVDCGDQYLQSVQKIPSDWCIRIADPELIYLQQFGRAIRPDTLKQAQRLAETLDRKHFGGNLKVPSDLTGCLNVIDHMTAQMVGAGVNKRLQDQNEAAIANAATYDVQLQKLANFIMSEIPGEPSQSEGAVDTAIRIMTEQRAAIQTASRRLAKWVKDAPAGYRTDESRAWLAANAPEALPPAFKRGDLVTWGAGQIYGRITKLPGENNDMWEVMTTGWNDGRPYNGTPGAFTNLTVDQGMRHVNK